MNDDFAKQMHALLGTVNAEPIAGHAPERCLLTRFGRREAVYTLHVSVAEEATWNHLWNGERWLRVVNAKTGKGLFESAAWPAESESVVFHFTKAARLQKREGALVRPPGAVFPVPATGEFFRFVEECDVPIIRS
jgi:hypothetical protein